MLDKALQKKIESVKKSLQGKKVLVAFSGGVDSSVMTRLALEFSTKVLAVTANSKVEPQNELEEARCIAEEIGVEWESIEINPLSNPNFQKNPPNRCYFCKKEIMSALWALAKERNLEIIIDGTNADDLKDVRPGNRAVQELKVKSPLAEAGITKKEIRLIAKEYKLSVFQKPAMACLASRIPYGSTITEQKLAIIAEAEAVIKTITKVSVVRVRHHGSIARIEVSPEDRAKFFNEIVLDQINTALTKLGFVYVTLDLHGYRSGSMNEALKDSPEDRPL